MMARGLQALGRLKVGAMNKTEAAYAATLEQRRAAGAIGQIGPGGQRPAAVVRDVDAQIGVHCRPRV